MSRFRREETQTQFYVRTVKIGYYQREEVLVAQKVHLH